MRHVRPGTISGDERVITLHSGTFGFPRNATKSATLYCFDKGGAELAATAAARSGEGFEVKVPPNGACVLERKMPTRRSPHLRSDDVAACPPPPARTVPAVTAECTDAADCTADIQAAMDSNASMVIIPSTSRRTWIVRPLFLRGYQRLVLQRGVTLRAKRAEFHGKLDSIFSSIHPREPDYRVCNSAIEGYGAELIMNQADYMNSNYTKAEWRSGITLDNVVNVSVVGLTISRTGGDGVMITGYPYSRNVYLADLTLVHAYRNALSVISVMNLTVERVVFSRAGEGLGTRPMAGKSRAPGLCCVHLSTTHSVGSGCARH